MRAQTSAEGQPKAARAASEECSLSSAFRLPKTAGTATAAASAGLAMAAAAGASLAGEVSDLAKEEQELNSPRTTEEGAAAPRRTARAPYTGK